MATPRTPLARAALIGNGMTWFGLSLLIVSTAAEHTNAAHANQWLNVHG